MEALRIQLDSLQWEVDRLDAENRRLRAGDAEASLHVDLEAELEQSKGDVATLTERVTGYEERAGASAREAAEAQS